MAGEHRTSPTLGGDDPIRDIHALTPIRVTPTRRNWETGSQRSSSISQTSEGGAYTSMSREFNALVLAGSALGLENEGNGRAESDVASANSNLRGIMENEEEERETNPFAIVPDNTLRVEPDQVRSTQVSRDEGEVSLERVKREEVVSKISAWQTAKLAKINNRFKREDVVINAWESEQLQKANSRMKKVERKLEEKRAEAMEKMRNEMAKARRKAEERRASAEAKRGSKVAKVFDLANLLRAVGKLPSKRSFF